MDSFMEWDSRSRVATSLQIPMFAKCFLSFFFSPPTLYGSKRPPKQSSYPSPLFQIWE